MSGHQEPTLLSVNVGLPQDVTWQGRTVHTGVWKSAVDGACRVRRLNLDGDGQGDLAGHGGEQRAVLVYQIDSYRHWQRELGRDDLVYGQFGENLTVDGLADDEVCIGDRYRIGDAEFEVTQPRVTCYRVGLRLGEPELPALLVGHHRPGFYMRVLREGTIRAGDPITRTRSGPHALTVAEADALLYLPGRDRARLRTATDIPALSPGWQGSFRELLDDHAPGSVPDEPAWDGFRSLRVAEVVRETDTVTSFCLAPLDGAPLPTARAGQYLTVRVAGAGEPAPVRSYSLSSAPGADRYRISVKQEPYGTVSGYLTGRVRAGAVLDVAAPRGEFVLGDGRSPILFLSAGIGVTPELAMLHECVARHRDREIWWIHGARTPHDQALGDEAHALLAALPYAHEHVFWSRAGTGRLTAEKLADLGLPTDADAYLCGPTAFTTDLEHALIALGVPGDRIHTELFAARSASTPGIVGRAAPPPHQPPGPPGTGPLVTFARSGLASPFPTTAGSVLELADACDVPTRWSCRTGVCHTCTTGRLSGDVTYSPAPLEPPADGQVLICCARPTSDVVLDL
ncbi:MAG TPA: MOSC domain-containing protein [Actinomycetospora sp.]|jgi:ferredoxin-NADP reductase/MOSC domain-containing protein YiiM|uniref:MOSC domain-containing protein n=1 Tax=Actinomycetospora sp. TaxID=1872135 RepID=UPI002F3FE79E